MRPIRIAAVLALLCCTPAYAQRVLAITTGVGYPLVSIDPPTGVVTQVMLTNTVADYSYAVFDSAARRLYYLIGDVGAQQLGIADLGTQTVSTISIATSNRYIAWEWDPVASRILALTGTPGVGVSIVGIDPRTGSLGTLLNIGPTDPVSFGITGYDEGRSRFFFLTGDVGTQQIVTADLATHSVTSRSIASSSRYYWFEWDSGSRRLLAILTASGTPIVSIDPATGVVQTVVNTNSPTPDPGYEAIDPLGRKLYFLDGPVGSQRIFIVDLQTLSVLSPSIATPVSYIFFENAGAPSPIPALSEYALLLLGIALATIALRR